MTDILQKNEKSNVFACLGQNLGIENNFEESYFHFRDFSEFWGIRI